MEFARLLIRIKKAHEVMMAAWLNAVAPFERAIIVVISHRSL